METVGKRRHVRSPAPWGGPSVKETEEDNGVSRRRAPEREGEALWQPGRPLHLPFSWGNRLHKGLGCLLCRAREWLNLRISSSPLHTAARPAVKVQGRGRLLSTNPRPLSHHCLVQGCSRVWPGVNRGASPPAPRRRGQASRNHSWTPHSRSGLVKVNPTSVSSPCT